MTSRRIENPMLEILCATGDGAPNVEQKLSILASYRNSSGDAPREADQFLIARAEETVNLRRAIHMIEGHQAKQRRLIESLTAEPFFPAVFLGCTGTPGGPRALVQHGTTRRVVTLMGGDGGDDGPDGLSLEGLSIGDEVLLTHEMNAIVAASNESPARHGEIAVFERRIGDGYALINWRGDEQVVVRLAGALDAAEIEAGDWIRWDRTAWIAFERIERPPMRLDFFDDVPDLGPACVGGQDQNLARLTAALLGALIDPKKARTYNQQGDNKILLFGPPGCGKTLMARVAAAELSRRTGRRCRFAVVKPSAWEDPFVGVTQRNIRETFRTLKEVSSDGGHAVLFLDEIESAGRIRGHVTNVHADKFLAALLAEIDGFERSDRVALLSASNRKDLIDPALLERLGGVEIPVERPRLADARAIFSIHLPASIPFHPNGTGAEATREEAIETAVSRLYSPNAQNELCVLRFRDGKTRTVTARELASGRLIEQICKSACRSAYLRDVRGGEPGVRVEDMGQAIEEAMARLRSTLTIHNVRAYLHDLPQDIDVIAVDPIVPRARGRHPYVAA
ncbi:MAG: AAA family ATPase [Planctomycetes bacterium]|nr:AAA family ATPase [Planctomycetota bacterium]